MEPQPTHDTRCYQAPQCRDLRAQVALRFASVTNVNRTTVSHMHLVPLISCSPQEIQVTLVNRRRMDSCRLTTWTAMLGLVEYFSRVLAFALLHRLS